MRKVILLLIVIVTGVLFVVSCSKGGSSVGGGGGGGGTNPDCANAPKTFAADASPLFQSFCNQAGCHNAGSVNGVGPLTNYAQIFAGRDRIRAAVSAGTMPQNTTLTAAQRNTILCWIDSGAPNN